MVCKAKVSRDVDQHHAAQAAHESDACNRVYYDRSG